MTRPLYLPKARNRWALVPNPPTDHPKAKRAWLKRGKLLVCCALEPFVAISDAGVHQGTAHLYHLSISHPTRNPTWDEITRARHDLLPEDVWMVQVVAPKAHHRTLHTHCFHLWESPEADSFAMARAEFVAPSRLRTPQPADLLVPVASLLGVD